MTFKGPFQPKPFYDSMSRSVHVGRRVLVRNAGDLRVLQREHHPHQRQVGARLRGCSLSESHLVPVLPVGLSLANFGNARVV